MVHRVDGPIGVYRGFDDGTDERIARVNAELAAATILQSRFSLEKHRELGLELRDPVVDPERGRPGDLPSARSSREPLDGRTRPARSRRAGRTTRARAATRSRWLDRNLDHARYELTFAGRAPAAFEHVRVVGPLDSNALADAPAHAGRLPRAELRRPVLERAPRGARVRPAGGLPRERRPSRARRRGRPAVPRGRGARRGRSTGSPRSSTSGARRSRSVRSRGSPTATSRSSGWAAPPRIPRPWRTTSDEAFAASATASAAARPRRRLARPRRALPVGRLDGGDVARRAGAQEPARPLGLPGDHGRDAAGAHRRDGHVSRRERVLPRLDLRPARGRRGRLDRRRARCATTTRAHPRITYLGGRSSTDPDVVAEVRARAEGSRRSSSSTRTTRRRTSRPSSPCTRRSSRSAAT